MENFLITLVFFFIASKGQEDTCERTHAIGLYFKANDKIISKFAFLRFLQFENSSELPTQACLVRFEKLEQSLSQQNNIITNLINTSLQLDKEIENLKI